MGRPESVIPGDGPVADLARLLRTLRHRAGLTLRQLADGMACSYSTLSRAIGGRHLPSSDVLAKFLQLCGAGTGDQAKAQRLWQQARRHRAQARAPQPMPWMPVADVASSDDLIAAMHCVRLDAGGPSLRDLEKRAKKLRLALPRSTVSDALRCAGRVPSWRLLEDYVRVCGVPEDQLWLWRTAWQRASGRVNADDLDMLGDLAEIMFGPTQLFRRQQHNAPPGPGRPSVGAKPSLLTRPLPPEVARRLPTVRIPAPRAGHARGPQEGRTAAAPVRMPPPG